MTPASAKGPKSSLNRSFERSPQFQNDQVMITQDNLPMINVVEDLGEIDRTEFINRVNQRYLQQMSAYFGQVLQINDANQLVEHIKSSVCHNVYEEMYGEHLQSEAQER